MIDLIVNLSELYSKGFLLIDEVYSFSKEELKDSSILRLDNVNINGNITKNSVDEYIINVEVRGTMVLPCSVTLKPVDYDFCIQIEGNIIQMMTEFNEKFENNQKTLDILPIIWENILMEIPIRIVSDDISDVKTKGEGWELITDDKQMVNPNLAKLKDLL